MADETLWIRSLSKSLTMFGAMLFVLACGAPALEDGTAGIFLWILSPLVTPPLGIAVTIANFIILHQAYLVLAGKSYRGNLTFLLVIFSGCAITGLWMVGGSLWMPQDPTVERTRYDWGAWLWCIAMLSSLLGLLLQWRTARQQSVRPGVIVS